MNRRVDVCIIGGGAAGLAAAASIDSGIRTCIVEKNEILGRKILATGGGRCNLTNAGCEGASATLDFFALLGLETFRDEEGRCYPYSGCASDVVKVLTDALGDRDCEVLTGCAAERVERIPKESGSAPAGGRFLVHTGNGLTIEADSVLLTTGGKAAPQFGTVGDGYRIAKMLGHSVTRLYPILTGIECSGVEGLKGIRARGIASLCKDGEKIGEEAGEIQFTADGLSGICVFNLTPLIHAEEGERPADAFRRYELVLDLAPDFTQEQIDARRSTFGILNERLAQRVGKDEIRKWRLPVTGVKGWRSAQCTAGGIPMDEVDPASQESRLVPGLYLAGEILNVQGPCGGYNLQNAWETGRRAAAAINAGAAAGRRTESGRMKKAGAADGRRTESGQMKKAGAGEADRL